MKLEDLFWNAYGTQQTLDTLVTIQKIDVVPLIHQLPISFDTVNYQTGGRVDWKSGKYLLLNARSAPFGDTVSFHQQRDRDAGVIIISGQEKWDYNGKEFTAASAVGEHTKATKTAAEKGLSGTIVTACFTSQPIDDITLPGMD